ncbi:MAG: hypothetical protein FWF86_02110 [Clostridia bacterium]|nr:hypothetical protein [Clostridia bacterium]
MLAMVGAAKARTNLGIRSSVILTNFSCVLSDLGIIEPFQQLIRVKATG